VLAYAMFFIFRRSVDKIPGFPQFIRDITFKSGSDLGFSFEKGTLENKDFISLLRYTKYVNFITEHFLSDWTASDIASFVTFWEIVVFFSHTFTKGFKEQ
jgi:hypothetical protein